MATTPYGTVTGSRSGSASFRLLPTDDAATGPSSGAIHVAAGGRAVSVTYTWTHPADGEQSGVLLLGLPTEEGTVSAAWVDSWHQREVIALAGHGGPDGAVVGYEYAPGWHWEVELLVSEGLACLVMRNAVPQGEDRPGGTYEVSRSDWR